MCTFYDFIVIDDDENNWEQERNAYWYVSIFLLRRTQMLEIINIKDRGGGVRSSWSSQGMRLHTEVEEQSFDEPIDLGGDKRTSCRATWILCRVTELPETWSIKRGSSLVVHLVKYSLRSLAWREYISKTLEWLVNSPIIKVYGIPDWVRERPIPGLTQYPVQLPWIRIWKASDTAEVSFAHHHDHSAGTLRSQSLARSQEGQANERYSTWYSAYTSGFETRRDSSKRPCGSTQSNVRLSC